MHSYEIERQALADRIYNINEEDFGTVAMDVWKFQYTYNALYQSYCNLLGVNTASISRISEIPFLPILMFREHEIRTGDWSPETIFRSSGTTGSIQSHHHIRNMAWYHRISQLCFRSAFSDPGDYTWLALLPSYMERPDSSLVDMVNHFMQIHPNRDHKFYPIPGDEIVNALHDLKSKNQKTILLGVSFALLDLFEKFKIPIWNNLLVIETGGMKGRRDELTREELHEKIKIHHPDVRISSEYGMTELLSQAYMKDLHFSPGPTMNVFTRDISDPLNYTNVGQRGAINIVDLGNLDTCSFIATDDIGICYNDGSFDVLGRLDQSDLRGCNLLYN
ncbi:MAG TPA: acyl transferase [Saprospiraceae bacterium]|nr:acyl transferase [Saprospiraceae bacterium]